MSKGPTNSTVGYLPNERPSWGKLILFAFQQVLVMFPATVLVALLTGFHVSTTIFASGFATLCFLAVTRGKLPLYYGSSFSYITAIVGITGATFGQVAADEKIQIAQFGIICSGLISIAAGLLVNLLGNNIVEKVLPPTITGSIALIIGVSLFGTAMQSAFLNNGTPDNSYVIVALVTVLSTVGFSVYLKKGVLSQIPILLGILVGYVVSIPFGLIDFGAIWSGTVVSAPHFTLPKPNLAAVFAIMPIALATIPESSAHLFQLDLYVNKLAEEKGKKGEYKISDKLGLNLIGDGIGDIASAMFGGPAGTNYGENLSTMAITKNFSVWVLGGAAVLSVLLSFITPLSNIVNSVPGPVINGACIFLFGVIGAQGIAIIVDKKVDLFDARNLAVIAVTLTVGIGGHFGFAGGMIPAFGLQMPAIATASIVGIALNLLLSIGKKKD